MQHPLKLYFLQILGKKDYSVAELTQKALAKDYPGSEIKQVLTELSSSNYVNDYRYAENLVQHYQGKKGKVLILMKLKQHKIPEDIIEKVTENLSDEIDPELKSKIQKKYQIDNWQEIDLKIQQKILNFLNRQGYSRPWEILESFKN